MENPEQVQVDLFHELKKECKSTEWGKLYDYASIKSIEEFQSRVPISNYETIFPFIDRMMHGESNVLWKGRVSWFSKSSGTTNAKSKFIPVTTEALKYCHYKGGKDLIALYFHNNPQSRMFDGKGLAIGGSYNANHKNRDSYYGDVSAVIMANLPAWARYARTPDIETALMGEWEEKLERIAKATIKENVTNISGVPTWTLILLEKILQMTGKKNVLEVWPQFEVFFHGAVAFHPYKEIFQKIFPKENMYYMETYNASEGFFGMQDDLKRDDMLLMLDYGVFYEFIPYEDSELEHPRTLTLGQVELDTNYAMVISTNAGLWRYKIGDTVKFTSKNPYRIKITGRTKHFINAFGEELIVENAESAITQACATTGARMSNFTAAPVYFDNNTKGSHEWIVEFATLPNSLEQFTQVLDKALMSLNSDYEAKRYKDIALQCPKVHAVAEGTFYNWMKKRGKLGAQNKVPRLANNREYLDDILNDLRENSSVY